MNLLLLAAAAALLFSQTRPLAPRPGAAGPLPPWRSAAGRVGAGWVDSIGGTGFYDFGVDPPPRVAALYGWTTDATGQWSPTSPTMGDTITPTTAPAPSPDAVSVSIFDPSGGPAAMRWPPFPAPAPHGYHWQDTGCGAQHLDPLTGQAAPCGSTLLVRDGFMMPSIEGAMMEFLTTPGDNDEGDRDEHHHVEPPHAKHSQPVRGRHPGRLHHDQQ